MMLYRVFLILFLSTSPTLVSTLNCYQCNEGIRVNYTVTSDGVPSFSDCQVVQATECLMSVTWDPDKHTTTLLVEGNHAVSVKDASQDTIIGMAYMQIEPDKETSSLVHNLLLSCVSSDTCNDETGLKKILRSLVIEDQFRQELYALIKIASSFDAKSAACLDFTNFTDYCPTTDLKTCERCQISVDKLLSFKVKVCATCPDFTIHTNMIMRWGTFLLNNRTQLVDHVQLDCQLTGCNSFDNVNRIYKASKITFDFDEYFKNEFGEIL